MASLPTEAGKRAGLSSAADVLKADLEAITGQRAREEERPAMRDLSAALTQLTVRLDQIDHEYGARLAAAGVAASDPSGLATDDSQTLLCPRVFPGAEEFSDFNSASISLSASHDPSSIPSCALNGALRIFCGGTLASPRIRAPMRRRAASPRRAAGDPGYHSGATAKLCDVDHGARQRIPLIYEALSSRVKSGASANALTHSGHDEEVHNA
jgi:hypothetical protein